jgi:hypothetical protein
VAGVCPQIVLYCTKQNRVEPEHAYKGNMEGLAVVPVVLAVVDCASKGLHAQKNILSKF